MLYLPDKLTNYSQFVMPGIPTQPMQRAIREKLETFIKGHRNAINHVKRKEAMPTYYQSGDICNGYTKLLNVVNHFLRKADHKICKYEIATLENIIDLTNEMLNFLIEHPIVNIDVDNFCDFLDNSGRENEDYRQMKRKRKSLFKKSKQIFAKIISPDYKNQIRLEFITANTRFDKDLFYSPPSYLDTVIIQFLIQSPVAESIKPTVQKILDGNQDVTLAAISDFCCQVYDLLNVSNEMSKAIVYTSLIRYLFDEAYVIHSELQEYNEENGIFLKKAEAFSKQSVRDLRLSKEILRNYTPGLSVSSMFKSKQLNMMRMMETMTNPIDLMKHVHTTISALAQYFGGDSGMLSFDDTLTLLLGLMSLSPPSNAVSISKFVDKWQCVQLSDIIGRSKDFFIAAVEMLMEDGFIYSSE